MRKLFARWEVLQVLVHLAFFIGDEAGASQVVRVVVVLLFFQDRFLALVVVVVRLLLDQLGRNALAAYEDVLARDLALADDVVGVDVERLALRRALEGALAVGVVDVIARLAVVAVGRYAVRPTVVLKHNTYGSEATNNKQLLFAFRFSHPT
jgi:hypothetical protein